MTDQRSTSTASDRSGFRPYVGVLAECRDLIALRTGDALAKAIAGMDEELEARRQATTSIEESLQLLEAQYQLRSLADSIHERFRNGFNKLFRELTTSKTEAGNVYGGDSSFLPELSLVAEEQISDELKVQNLANRLQGACEPELQNLQPRIAMMLGQDELDAADNPVGPAAICETLREVCWSLDGAQDNRAMLLEMLVGRLKAELVPIYHDVNELLAARKINPRGRTKLRPGNRPEPDEAAPPASGAGTAESAADTANVVQRLFAAREAGVGAGPNQGTPLRPDWQTATGGVELMQMLTRLQQGEESAVLGEDAFSLAAAGASGTTNVLNALLEAGITRHLGSVDGIVIDVVATLFDYIFDDERVPDTMKGLIGRLQIPVLKLALMDHSFFSNRHHPARRLINLLAQAAATWDGVLTDDSTLYQVSEAIVLRIQDEFTDSPEVFATCLTTLDTYLLEQERYADERAATLTNRLEERERVELARGVAQNAVATHLADTSLPASVRGFLSEVWIKTLTHATLHDDDSGARWQAATSTMNDLVWSVQPKKGADARQQLVKRLPPMLAGLRAGMAAAGMAEDARETFLAELVKLHAAALKADMAPTEAPTGDTPEKAKDAMPSPPPPALPEPQEDPEVDGLKRGDWIELKDETGEVRRVRLAWISPARTMYLFANRQGQRALALTRSELIRRFAAGEAVSTDDEALIDRIVDDVLDGYQAQTGGGQT